MKTAILAIIMGFYVNSALARQTENTTKTTPPEPCSSKEYRQLAFWVGDWNLWYDQGQDKPKGTAHNRITKSPYSNCIITENFSMPGFNGMSISTFHKPIGLWHQTWVDDQGGYFDLVGGPAPEGADHDFGLELVHPKGIKAPYLRMTWKIINKDHLIWRWQSRASGKTRWTDQWVLHYFRAGSSEDKHSTEV